MSISTINNNILKTQKEIADLKKKISQEIQKQHKLNQRISEIKRSIARSKSSSSFKSKNSEIQRKVGAIAKIESRRTILLKKQADKKDKLSEYQKELAKEQDK